MKKILVPLILALSACQPLPHPFEHDQPNEALLSLPDTYGVIVEPVTDTDAPLGNAITNTMVKALQDIDVPASAKVGNRKSFRLTGNVTTMAASGTIIRLDIVWTMRGADGKEITTDVVHVSLPKSDADTGTGTILDAAAKSEASKLASFIRDKAPVERPVDRHIFVKPVADAPGDGEKSLQNALIYALKQRGMDVVTDPAAPRTITISGVVTLTPIDPSKDHIRIVWHVLSPDGTDVAQATQENNVAHGTLTRPWGTIAIVIAGAAVDDILNIVQGTALGN